MSKDLKKKIAFIATFQDQTGGLATLRSMISKTSAELSKFSGKMRATELGLSKIPKTLGKALSQRSKEMSKAIEQHQESLMLPSIGGLAGAGLSLMAPATLELEKNKLSVIAKSIEKVGDSLELVKIKDAELNSLVKYARTLEKFSAPETLAAMNEVASHGWNDTATLKSTSEPLLNLTGAGQFKLHHYGIEQAAIVATNLSNAFGLQREKFAEMVDKLTYAFSNSATNIEELGEGAALVGGLGTMMNVSLEETLAIMMGLADKKKVGTIAGTAMVGLMSRLARLEGGALNIIHDKFSLKEREAIMGRDGKFAPHGFLNFLKIMRDKDKKKELSPGEMMTLMGQDAGAHMVASFDVVDHIFHHLKKLKEGAPGLAKSLSNVQFDGLKGRLKLLQAAVVETSLKIGIDGEMVGNITRYVDRLKGSVKRLNEYLTPEKSKTIASGIEILLGGLLLRGGFKLLKAVSKMTGLSWLGTNIAKPLLRRPMRGLRKAFLTRIKRPFLRFGASVMLAKLFNSSMNVLVKGVLAIGPAIAAAVFSWQVLITGGIAATGIVIGKLVYDHWEKVKLTTSNAISAIGDYFMGLFDRILFKIKSTIPFSPMLDFAKYKVTSSIQSALPHLKALSLGLMLNPMATMANLGTFLTAPAAQKVELPKKLDGDSQQAKAKDNKQASVKLEIDFKNIPRGADVSIVRNQARVPIDMYKGYAGELIG